MNTQYQHEEVLFLSHSIEEVKPVLDLILVNLEADLELGLINVGQATCLNDVQKRKA